MRSECPSIWLFTNKAYGCLLGVTIHDIFKAKPFILAPYDNKAYNVWDTLNKTRNSKYINENLEDCVTCKFNSENVHISDTTI